MVAPALLCHTAPLQVTAPQLAQTQGTYGRGGLQLWAGRAGRVSHRGRLKNKTKQKNRQITPTAAFLCRKKDLIGMGACAERGRGRHQSPNSQLWVRKEVHGRRPWVRVTPLPCRVAQGVATAKPGAAAPKAPSVMGGSGAEARRCPWRSSGLSASSWAGWSWSRA